jgi:hypothetical protein
LHRLHGDPAGEGEGEREGESMKRQAKMLAICAIFVAVTGEVCNSILGAGVSLDVRITVEAFGTGILLFLINVFMALREKDATRS